MWPLLGAAVIGGISSLFSSKSQADSQAKSRAALNAQMEKNRADAAARQQLLEQQAATGQGYINAADTNARIAQAGRMYKAANDNEMNQAIQGALVAYGGSPLSGNARAAVISNLAGQARNNWQQALTNANAMMNQDTANKLGIHNNLMSGTSGIGSAAMQNNQAAMGSLANLAAVRDNSLLQGLSTGLTAYGALK
jgi:hypothetical protein